MGVSNYSQCPIIDVLLYQTFAEANYWKRNDKEGPIKEEHYNLLPRHKGGGGGGGNVIMTFCGDT